MDVIIVVLLIILLLVIVYNVNTIYIEPNLIKEGLSNRKPSMKPSNTSLKNTIKADLGSHKKEGMDSIMKKSHNNNDDFSKKKVHFGPSTVSS